MVSNLMDTNAQPMGRRFCAWCGDDLGPVPMHRAGVISHGICEACFAVEKRKLDKQNALLQLAQAVEGEGG